MTDLKHSGVVRQLARAQARVEDSLLTVAALTALVMMVYICSDVFFRYVLGSPLAGATEIVSTYLMVALIWLAAPTVERHDRNVAIELLMRHASNRVQAFVAMIGNLLCAGIIAVIAWLAYETAFDSLGQRSAGLVRIPTAPPYFVLCAGAALLAVRLLVKAATAPLRSRDAVAGGRMSDEPAREV